MTQPNPGPAPAAPEPNQNPTPATPAAGAAPEPQPTIPGLTPEGGTAAEDDRAQQLLADAVAAGAQGDPGQLGDAGKKALAAERARAKAAEEAAKADRAKLADLEKQLKALQPAADIFAQIRKAAVPEGEKTDTEKLADRLAEMEKTAGDERLARLRLEVIGDKGLTKAHAKWLAGETYEELAASADELLALFPQPAPAPTAVPNGQPADQGGNGQQPAATPPTPAAPRPDPTQGARGQGIDLNAQIQDALAKGDVKTSIALKQQLAAQARGNQ